MAYKDNAGRFVYAYELTNRIMEKEVIVINEPYEIGKDFKEGTLLNVKGKVLKVEKDTCNESGCNVCALDDYEELDEYCACAFCGDCHFIEITL